MPKWRRVITIAAVGLVFVASAAIAGTSGAAAAGAMTASGPSTTCADPGAKDPVLLVHGFNDDATTWKTATATNALFGSASGLAVSSFVYGDSASQDMSLSYQWVTNVGIGHDLAETISCLAMKSAQHDGIGRVFLVGHSMGGLAIRCAISPSCNDAGAGAVNGIAQDIAAVITFGTPNQGSFLRVDRGASDAESAVSELLTGLCAIASPVPVCGVINDIGNSPASVGFTPGSKQLQQLPPFNPAGAPPTIPVREDAGELTITDTVGLWHDTLAGNAGDLVVGTGSATSQAAVVGGVGGSVIQQCGNVDISSVAAALGLGVQNALAGLVCEHTDETRSDAFLVDAFSTIAKWRMLHDPTQLTLEHISGAPHVSVPVAVPGGYEAAAWSRNTSTAITFWKWTTATLTWQKIGSSTLPTNQDPSSDPEVVGMLPTGANDAAFIVSAGYSGDGSGNVVGYSTGPNGWGVLHQPTPTTYVSSGTGDSANSGMGIQFEMRASGGDLEVTYQNEFFTSARGAAYPLNVYWKWTGNGFVDDHDNAFTAAPAVAYSTGAALPSTSCPATPPDGTYHVGIAGVAEGTNGVPEDGNVHVTVTALNPSTATGTCAFALAPNTPMTVQENTSSGAVVWETAPAWLLVIDLPELAGGPEQIFPEMVQQGTSPYYIPASLHVTSIASYLGVVNEANIQQDLGVTPTGTVGNITVHGGKVVAITIEPS